MNGGSAMGSRDWSRLKHGRDGLHERRQGRGFDPFAELVEP
jgi:hypothetical protein